MKLLELLQGLWTAYCLWRTVAVADKLQVDWDADESQTESARCNFFQNAKD